jgi:ABC-type phosphate/phosphonate transport system substrate-binding protein
MKGSIIGKLLFCIGLLILLGCQPPVFEVEVTRLVDVNGVGGETAVSNPTTLEVTRIVPVEVTRIVSEEVIVEVTKSPLGSTARPIQLLFAPDVNTAVIQTRVPALRDFLANNTSVSYEIGVLDSEQAVIDMLCAAPADTIGFLSATGYVLAHDQCGASPANTGINTDDLSWQAGMIVIRADSGIQELSDLAGKSWAVPDMDDLETYSYFRAIFADLGIEVGEIVAVQGDNTAMLAVLNGEVDFATGSFVPPILPFEEEQWIYSADTPEVWRRLGIAPTRSGQGFVIVNGLPENGGYRVRDARSGIFDIAPTVFDETRILTLSAQIPNKTIVFGPAFPISLATEIVPLLAQFAVSELCGTSICSADFYNWTGLSPATNTDFDPIRFVLENLEN